MRKLILLSSIFCSITLLVLVSGVEGACIALYDPVCGINDKTYSNACEAGVEGVSVKHKGECRKYDKPICGQMNNMSSSSKPSNYLCKVGFSSDVSDSGDWTWNCSLNNQTVPCSAKKGDADMTIHETCDDVIDWVCGSNGITYMNSCETRGVGIISKGKCESGSNVKPAKTSYSREDLIALIIKIIKSLTGRG